MHYMLCPAWLCQMLTQDVVPPLVCMVMPTSTLEARLKRVARAGLLALREAAHTKLNLANSVPKRDETHHQSLNYQLFQSFRHF